MNKKSLLWIQGRLWHQLRADYLCCGGRIRTYDLWVMSPTSYHCSTPRYLLHCKGSTYFLNDQNNVKKAITTYPSLSIFNLQPAPRELSIDSFTPRHSSLSPLLLESAVATKQHLATLSIRWKANVPLKKRKLSTQGTNTLHLRTTD